MKMTVNGYEIEGSPQEIQQYLDLIVKKPASPPTPPAPSTSSTQIRSYDSVLSSESLLATTNSQIKE